LGRHASRAVTLGGVRKAFVHMIRGELKVNVQKINTGDAQLLEQESQTQITDAKKAEILVFDLAP